MITIVITCTETTSLGCSHNRVILKKDGSSNVFGVLVWNSQVPIDTLDIHMLGLPTSWLPINVEAPATFSGRRSSNSELIFGETENKSKSSLNFCLVIGPHKGERQGI